MPGFFGCSWAKIMSRSASRIADTARFDLAVFGYRPILPRCTYCSSNYPHPRWNVPTARTAWVIMAAIQAEAIVIDARPWSRDYVAYKVLLAESFWDFEGVWEESRVKVCMPVCKCIHPYIILKIQTSRGRLLHKNHQFPYSSSSSPSSSAYSLSSMMRIFRFVLAGRLRPPWLGWLGSMSIS